VCDRVCVGGVLYLLGCVLLGCVFEGVFVCRGVYCQGVRVC